ECLLSGYNSKQGGVALEIKPSVGSQAFCWPRTLSGCRRRASANAGKTQSRLFETCCGWRFAGGGRSKWIACRFSASTRVCQCHCPADVYQADAAAGSVSRSSEYAGTGERGLSAGDQAGSRDAPVSAPESV